MGFTGRGPSQGPELGSCRRQLCAAHCDSLSTLRVRYGGVHGVVRVSIVLHGRQARWWLSCDGEAESVGYLGVACTKASACRGVSRTTADAVGSAFEGALIARRALLVAGFAGEIFSGDGSAETTGLMLPERLCRIAATFGLQDAASMRSIGATCDDLADSTVSPTDGTAARQTRAWQP